MSNLIKTKGQTNFIFRKASFIRTSIQQIFSIDVFTDNYLPPFSKDLFRLLANCFLLLGFVNILDTIG